jgi:hypothetical protein
MYSLKREPKNLTEVAMKEHSVLRSPLPRAVEAHRLKSVLTAATIRKLLWLAKGRTVFLSSSPIISRE